MTTRSFNQEAGGVECGEEEEEHRSSLQKTIGNAMNFLNDGLYRIKNRAKSE